MTGLIFKPSPREQGRAVRSQQAPHNMRGRLSAVVHSKEEAAELAYRMGGADVRPTRPVLVDTGHTRVMVVGAGEATASELSELAISAIEKQEGQRRQTGTDLDFNAMRERAGLMRREEADPAIRQALRDRVAKHKANPVTDAARQPVHDGPYRKSYLT